MKISQEVRDYAEGKGIDDIKSAVDAGLKDKAEEFKKTGAEIYRKA